MGNIEFAWNRRKAQSNLVKHGVSFEEAQTVFLDENAGLIDAPDHSEDEERFVPMGHSFQARCLIASHCYREPDIGIRLFLRDCAIEKRRPVIQWPREMSKRAVDR